MRPATNTMTVQNESYGDGGNRNPQLQASDLRGIWERRHLLFLQESARYLEVECTPEMMNSFAQGLAEAHTSAATP